MFGCADVAVDDPIAHQRSFLMVFGGNWTPVAAVKL